MSTDGDSPPADKFPRRGMSASRPPAVAHDRILESNWIRSEH